MPDSKCDKCNLTLGPICKSQEEVDRFADLVNKRSTRLMGMITSITPGIKHNEIDIQSECDGVMWYQPLYPTPKNVDWGA